MKLFRWDSAARVAILYLVVAGLYVLLSDKLVAVLVAHPGTIAKIGSIKGLAFVVITAILLYVERKHTERESNYLASIVESANAAIIGADNDGLITSWNRGAEQLYGYSAAEAIGRPTSIIYPPQRKRDFKYILDKVHRGESIRDYETIRMRKDGSTLPISLIVSPIRDSSGHITGLSSNAHDISEWKRAEKALQMAEVGQLASGLVHEIRNPLNAMRMQIAVIQDSLESAAAEDIELARTQLQRLEDEVLRVQKLANDFLAYGRPARGEPEIIDISHLAAGVASFMRSEFEKINAEVEVVIDGEPDDLKVVMDRDQLRQILVNIAENGRQAISGGAGGRLTITCDQPDPKRVRIRLCDDGVGISPDELPRIFDAFFSTKHEGTGLGLAIVKKIVESANGVITAESELGQGTCIAIEFPAAPRIEDRPAAGVAEPDEETA